MFNPQTFKILRITRGYTQSSFAEEMNTRRWNVVGWETGRHEPSDRNQNRIARILGVEVETLHADIEVEFHDEMVERLRSRFFGLVESEDRGDVREALRIARYIYPKPIYISGNVEISEAQKQIEDDLTDEVPEGWVDE